MEPYVDLRECRQWFCTAALWIAMGEISCPPEHPLRMLALALCVWFSFLSIAVAGAMAGFTPPEPLSPFPLPPGPDSFPAS